MDFAYFGQYQTDCIKETDSYGKQTSQIHPTQGPQTWIDHHLNNSHIINVFKILAVFRK